jgi:hypothetical protein
MPGYYDDPAQRLSDLLDQQETRIGNIFRTSIEALKDEIDLTEMADLIERGQLVEALDKLQHAAEQLGAASNVAYMTSGQSTADFMTGAGVGRVVFDQVNIAAVAAMQANRLRLIREFTDEQRRATSLALISGVESGINPIAQARNFRDSIGLTERQWGAVANYRSALERVGTTEAGQMAALDRALRDKRGDAQIRRAIRQSQRLAPAKIDWLVERYTARYVKHRSEVIGRTEALRSVHAGNHEMYRQAIENGTVNAEDLEQKWVTRLDGRERDTHLLLNGEKRRWGEVWETRHGVLRYPGDEEAPASETIQCRCALTTRIRQA